MTTSRAQQAAQTRRTIVQTARCLFAERGYDATSLQQIADAMGVQKANVYYYFKTKDAILSELLREMTAPLRGLVDRLREEPDPDLRVRILAATYAREVVRSYRTDGPLNLGDPMLLRDPEASAVVDALAADAIDVLFGESPTPDQRVGFWMILDLGPALRRLGDLDDETLVDAIERLCLRAVGWGIGEVETR